MLKIQEELLMRVRLFVFGVLISVLFGACGLPKKIEEKEQDQGKGLSAEVQTELTTLWKEKGFDINNSKDFAKEEEQSNYWEIACSETELREPDFRYKSEKTVTGNLANARYFLTNFECESGNRLVLEKHANWPTETEILELSMSENVQDVFCMDVVSEADIALLCGNENQIILFHLNPDGSILSEQEVTADYTGKEISKDEIESGFWWCDEAGNSYVWNTKNNSLNVFDSKGTFLIEESFGGILDTAEIMAAFHMPDGSLIFVVSDQEKAETLLFWFDMRKKVAKQLASFHGIGMRQFSMQKTGDLYYSDAGNIWRWNVTTGKKERLISLLETNIHNNMQESIEHIVVSETGALLVYVHSLDGDKVYVFSDEEPEQVGITIMDFASDSWLKKCTSNYNRKNKDKSIQYNKADYKDEESWTRVMAELVAGKGPDIINLFDREKLEIVSSKGILTDMTELLPDEAISQIFSGARSFGTVDGTLVGLSLYGMPIVMVTSNQLWKDEHWKDKDILEIVQNNSHLEGLFCVNGQLSPGMNLNFMINKHPESNGFIDFQKGISLFNTDMFRSALEVSKKYGELPGCSALEGVEKIVEGSYLASVESLFYSGQYAELMEKYGENCHFVSFPGQEEYVGYWNSGRLLAVNKNSMYQEEIADFLEYLLDSENLRQIEAGVPAVECAIRDSVCWDEWSEKWVYQIDSGGAYPFTREDGESYLEEYVSFLNSLGPWPEDSHIVGIIDEETADYFKGIKDVNQTAELIQNRVQLYLNEK